MNWHARTCDEKGNAVEVIFHIPIAAGNNRAAVSYRTALVKSGLGGVTAMTEGSANGEITTAEKTQVVAGEIYEVTETFHTNPGETANQLRLRIDARYTELAAQVPPRLQNILSYWGYDRNVP